MKQQQQQQPRQHQKKRIQQRPRNTTAAARARALTFIVEQNRLLQRDNKALIEMVARLRGELEEKNDGIKSAKGAKRAPKAVRA